MNRYPLTKGMPELRLAIADWLQRRFADVTEVWTSEDSISMIYEALTAGAPLGLLKLRRGKANRITAAVDALVERGCGLAGDRLLDCRRRPASLGRSH